MKKGAGPQQFTFVYRLDRRSKQQNALNSEEKELGARRCPRRRRR